MVFEIPEICFRETDTPLDLNVMVGKDISFFGLWKRFCLKNSLEQLLSIYNDRC